ncbi:MAG TPA: UvrD-helicase domain-containing protein, partial [Leptospiraceae bacterium]|nr:UvrD-helicase domain-containing protein [Leptospiraceae bacterium]
MEKNELEILKFGFHLYEASAGTGKTYKVVDIIVNFIIEGISLKELAVLTFTEKAGGELQERVRRKLGEVLRGTADDVKIELTEERRKHLTEQLEVLSTAKIGTIHQFCRTLLRKYTIEAGLSPSWQEIRETEIYEKVFMDYFGTVEKFEEEDLKSFLKDCGWDVLKNFCIQSFSRTGFVEFDEIKKSDYNEEDYIRVYKNFLNAVQDIPAKHLTKLKAEEASQASADYASGMDIFESLIRNGILKKTDSLPAKYYLDRICRSDGEQEELRNRMTEIQNKKSYHKIYPNLNVLRKHSNGFKSHLKKYFAAKSFLTPDLIIQYSRNLISENQSVRKEVSDEIRFLTVDECQDSDPVQLDLFEKLFADRKSGLIFVGDPKQSIYRFRNADSVNYNDFVNKMRFRKNTLNETRRSAPGLAEVFNRMFVDAGIGYSPVTAHRKKNPCSAPSLLLLGLDEKNAPLEDGEWRAADLRENAADEICSAIEKITDNPEFLTESEDSTETELKTRKISCSDIAVLSSSNSDLQFLLKKMTQKGIPASIYKSEIFYEDRLVFAYSCILNAVENPADTDSLYKALVSDLFLFPEDELSFYSLKFQENSNNDELNKIYSVLRDAYHESLSSPVSGILKKIAVRTGFYFRISIGAEGRRNLTNFYHLLEILDQLQFGGNLSFSETVRTFRRNIEKGKSQALKLDNLGDVFSPDSSSVRLMTMHASKGLEFRVCILFNLFGKNRPDMGEIYYKDKKLSGSSAEVQFRTAGMQTEGYEREHSSEAEELYSEKKRLLYVSMTRARDYLIFPMFVFGREGDGSFRMIIRKFLDSKIPDLFRENLALNLSLYPERQKSDRPVLKKKTASKKAEFVEIPQEVFREKSRKKIFSYSSLKSLDDQKRKKETETDQKPEESGLQKSQKNAGGIFGSLCHLVLENIPVNSFVSRAKIKKAADFYAEKFYSLSGLQDDPGYSKNDLVQLCVNALDCRYEISGQKVRP